MRVRNIKLIRILIGLIVLIPIVYFAFSRGKAAVKKQSIMRYSAKIVELPKLSEEIGNYETIPIKDKNGPGEYGKPYHLPLNMQNLGLDSEMEYGMNIAVSDVISYEREIPDTRLKECRHWNYPEDLPKTSVIIVFHNEGLSVLLRTVHSVINRSPKHLLKEILLVDDFSDKENLKTELPLYIKKFPIVKLIKNQEREGLIRTRARGAIEATGSVIVFLDAHCEVNSNWLPPLLSPIYRDRTVMTVPIIDGIDHKTFEYRAVYGDSQHFRGIFEWGMLYKENEVPKKRIKTKEI